MKTSKTSKTSKVGKTSKEIQRRFFFFSLFIALTLVIVSMSSPFVEAGKGCYQKHKKERQGLIEKLSKDKKSLFKSAMGQVHKEKEKLHHEKKALHAEMKDLMSASTFNEAAFTKKVEKIQTLNQQKQKSYYQAMLNLAKQFNKEERGILSEFMVSKDYKGKHKCKHKKGQSCPYCSGHDHD